MLQKNQNEDSGHAAQWDLDYDHKNGFPETPKHKILPYATFNHNIFSREAESERVILDVIEENYEEWIDDKEILLNKFLDTDDDLASFKAILIGFRFIKD